MIRSPPRSTRTYTLCSDTTPCRSNLIQARLNSDSVQIALQEYLQTFEQTCNLDVLSSYMDSVSPARADYYFVGRQRVPPYQYFWRKAEVELSDSCTAINPAAWSEWLPVDQIGRASCRERVCRYG